MAGNIKQVSESGSGSEDEFDKEESLANDLVVTKYTQAADIANSVLKEVIAAVKEGVEVGFLCDLGDRLILERTSMVFKKEEIQKGIAMPTCISVDNCICHYSPLRSNTELVLHNGQMVKIDLGAHIDGYVATVAHTVVVGASPTEKIKSQKANVIMAAYRAMEAAIRMLRPGMYKNMDVTGMIDQISGFYKANFINFSIRIYLQVKPVENMLSHQLLRNKIDGEKQIIQNPGEKQRAEMTKCSFKKYEAYAIDIVMSTGEGHAKLADTNATVYKRTDDVVYSLKMKAARTFFSNAMSRFGSMPFTLRAFEEKAAKLGVVECKRHNLLQPFQVRSLKLLCRDLKLKL
uniref:Peptidase_M24 domain-containing protein n=1 Tax=Syphacia muris TaxID=451379 RepID=A0A0N5AVG1_9BILA